MDQDCLFCKIIKGEIPSKKVYEDFFTFAFWDVAPKAPTHIIIVPKVHVESVNDLDADNVHYIPKIFETAKTVAAELGLTNGYRIVNNCGADGGQTVPHLHFHLLGGRNLGELTT